MSGTLLRATTVIAFAFHGLGHAMGIIPALGIIDRERTSRQWLRNWPNHSWLLTDRFGEPASRFLCIGLYGAGLIGFLCAATAMLDWGIPHHWGRMLASLSALSSLIAVLLFLNALIFLLRHRVGALAVNTTALICLLVLEWPTEVGIGF